jgi:hypothetical protein
MGRQSGIAVNCLQDLAQDAEAADAGDQEGRCRSGVDADRWTGADPIARSLGTGDFVIGNLEANFVALFAAV